MASRFANFKNFSVIYNPEHYHFQCFYSSLGSKKEQLFMAGQVSMGDGSDIPPLKEPQYSTETRLTERIDRFSYRCADPCYHFEIVFALNSRELSIRIFGNVILQGMLHWSDDPDDTFAGLFEANSPVLHAASGPVTRSGDDMLFDRKDDRVLRFLPHGHLKLGFDWHKNCYSFMFSHQPEVTENGLCMRVIENFLAEKLNIRYRPIEKRNWFSTPPVGWMTWYAVRFEAGEKEVLENTAKMQELLGAYCDNLVSWVDWEWYHGNHSGKCDDCDVFTPRTDVYPNGMAYVADKISEMGCIPAIWVGLTNDGRLNKWFEAHRDCVIGPLPRWCGQWWVDLTRPEVIQEYVPMVMKELKDWGYKAVKWDCLSITPAIWAERHDLQSDQSISPDSALHRTLQAGRKELGDDIFMLYCNPVSASEIAMASDVFNGARIGGDIFGWYEFVERAVDRLFHFFPMHNTLFYADCDNIVLRKEYCTMTQVRSRVSFYGITGVPVTIGDRFREYDPPRLDMLRRIVPVVDTHPVELQSKKFSLPMRLIVTSFSRPFGSWQVAAVMNTGEELLDTTLDFVSDCRLAAGGGERYAVYDYWKRRFLGVFERSVPIAVDSCDTAVLRITPMPENGLPLLISSSRHLTQGGHELIALRSDTVEKTVCGTVKCVAGEVEELTFLIPAGAVVKAVGGNWSQDGVCGVLHIETPNNLDADWKLELV